MSAVPPGRHWSVSVGMGVRLSSWMEIHYHGRELLYCRGVVRVTGIATFK